MEYQTTQFKGISDKQHQGVGAEYVSNFVLDRDGVLSPVLAMTKETAAGAPVKRVIEGTSTVWGLGNNAGNARVYSKSAITDAWSGFYTNAAGTGTFYSEMFYYYDETDTLYYYDGTNLRAYDIGAVSSATTALGSHTTRTDMFKNPNDGKLYFSTNGKLHRVDQAGTVSTDIAPSLPDNFHITHIDVYGVYLLVTCKSTDATNQKSVAYLIDVDIATPAPIDFINIGDGEARIGVNVGGTLVFVTSKSAGTYNKGAAGLSFSYHNGGDFTEEFLFMEGLLSTSSIPNISVKYGKRVFFTFELADFGENDTDIAGIMSIGKIGDSVEVVNEYSPDFAVSEVPEAFSITKSGYVYIATSDDKLWRTPNTASYELGVYITNKISNKRIGRKLDLKNTALRTEPLPAAGVVNLYYRVDENSAWTQIIAETTDSNVVTRAEHDNSGDRFEEGYEYQFKIEGDGGAVITGFYANFEEDNE